MHIQGARVGSGFVGLIYQAISINDIRSIKPT